MESCTGLSLPTNEVDKLIHDIKLGKIEGSYCIAMKTLELIKKIISKTHWKSADEIMHILRTQGRIFVAALPHESVMANMVRRVLKLIRDVHDTLEVIVNRPHGDNSQAALSLHKLVTQNSENDPKRDYSQHQDGLRNAVINDLQEIEIELETGSENFAEQAAEHIHSSELILTLGYSRTVESFLKSAAKKRKFEVVVAECAPACRGHALAANLAKANIETTTITDAAIFAMMSRVNKVIIGTHSVLANGGLRAACGSFSLALAAKHYSVPVIVLVPMYKLTPVHLCSYEQDAFNLVECTESVIPYSLSAAKKSRAYSPIFDYVPHELVTLFISNVGGNAPSYVYRLLSELYHPEDYNL